MIPKGIEDFSKVCVLTSGGLDSALLLQLALEQEREVYPLFIHSGFSWDDAELYWLKQVLHYLKSPSLQELATVKQPLNLFLEKFWGYVPERAPGSRSAPDSICIPGRNLFLLSQAGFYCQAKGIQEIWLGTLNGFAFPDRTLDFFETFAGVLESSFGPPFKIQTPFIELSKAELIQANPKFPYHLTFSCLRPNGKLACGSCNKCEERRNSFHLAGVALPLVPKTGLHSEMAEKKTMASDDTNS